MYIILKSEHCIALTIIIFLQGKVPPQDFPQSNRRPQTNCLWVNLYHREALPSLKSPSIVLPSSLRSWHLSACLGTHWALVK
ncbi:hypothetical protein DPMN_184937 [Dreissena polymorpha]|uniref:Uncharacterized protein n=1 Tax=Dreissena polymorpha TaxID=45954 RepID=A0A9D4I6U6_DREPO|nr:hypothetical protein DPMN_184937 [Dreissena polymorpha]